MKNLSPIVLFAYDRPDHLEVTLRSLNRNPEASQSRLTIYCDGPKDPKNPELLQRVHEVRRLARAEKWCGETRVVESPLNRGLADSIIGGVTETLENSESVIVLEDDLDLSPGFLRYMNEALNEYAEVPEVMHVSAYTFPVRQRLPETYFFNTASCWGWGTWRRAWKLLRTDAQDIKNELLQRDLMHRFNLEGRNPFSDQLDMNISGRKKTWAIKWYGTLMLNGGYSLHPGRSLVNNIGHDGSGQNCGPSPVFGHDKLADQVSVRRIEIKEHARARKYIADYLAYVSTERPSVWQKLRVRLPYY